MARRESSLGRVGWWAARPRQGADRIGPSKRWNAVINVAALAVGLLYLACPLTLWPGENLGSFLLLPAAGVGLTIFTAKLHKLSERGLVAMLAIGGAVALSPLAFAYLNVALGWPLYDLYPAPDTLSRGALAGFVLLPLTSVLWTMRWRTSRAWALDPTVVSALEHARGDRVVRVDALDADRVTVTVLGPAERRAEVERGDLGPDVAIAPLEVGEHILLVRPRTREDEEEGGYREAPIDRLEPLDAVRLGHDLTKPNPRAQRTAALVLVGWHALLLLVASLSAEEPSYGWSSYGW